MTREEKPKRWTVRKRWWPNGRLYFVVMRGSDEAIVGNGGCVSIFYDRDQAKEIADRENGVKRKPVADPLIEEIR